mgnify:CR=1 FL=1
MKAKIVVADDEPHIRKMICRLLTDEGYEVMPAENGREAVEVFLSFQPDVVLLDQQMPQKSGLDFARELKNNPHDELKNIPIIMITVDTKEKTVLEAKILGIQEYLVKPISPLALKKRICSALGIKQERV